MAGTDELRAFLAEQARAAVEQGLWTFAGTYLTRERIPPERLYALHDGWVQLAADLLLEQPSAGLVGARLTPRTPWIRDIAAVLQQRGIELPTTEVMPTSGRVWGVPFADYPRGAAVTVFVDIHTLGGQVLLMRQLVEAQGLTLRRAICLVDRHPTRTTRVGGIPLDSVIHLPLSLWRHGEDPSATTPAPTVSPNRAPPQNLRYRGPLMS